MNLHSLSASWELRSTAVFGSLGNRRQRERPGSGVAPEPREPSAPAPREVGAALGMGEPEPESEQIRLKCVRKEGFFTVPPEHRVRSEVARGRAALAADGRARQGPGPQCRAKAPRFPARAGTAVPEFLAAGAEAGGQPRQGGAAWVPGVLSSVFLEFCAQDGLGKLTQKHLVSEGGCPWEPRRRGL